ncbi:MAG: pilus assembly protein [Lachnospiraceae bacterium]|nr:pilus assembly protein [Lachnospiraceae bacterium]
MKRRGEKGSLTVEAAIVLVIFIFGYAAIVSITSFIRAQMIIQYSITQAAKEISAYCYLVSKTGVMKDSGDRHNEAGEFKKTTDNTIDTVAKLYEAIGQGTKNITDTVEKIPENSNIESALSSLSDAADVTQEEYNNIVGAANTVFEEGKEYFSDPKAILKGIMSVGKDEAFSLAKSYAIAAPISKLMVKSQIGLYGESGGKDILAKLGVVNGAEGLDFTGSQLFNDGKTITVQASYTMKVSYPGFDQKEFHFTQCASTEAWGSKDKGHPWRE